MKKTYYYITLACLALLALAWYIHRTSMTQPETEEVANTPSPEETTAKPSKDVRMALSETTNPDQEEEAIKGKVVPRPTDWTDRVAATNYWLYLLDKHADLAYKIPDTATMVDIIISPSVRTNPKFGEEKELLDLAYAMHAVLLKGEFQMDENPPEPWIRPLEEEEGRDTKLDYRRLSEIEMAWRAEFDLHLLNKYDGWTEEMAMKRFWEHNAANRWDEMREVGTFLRALGRVQRRATPPPDRGLYGSSHFIALDIDELNLIQELDSRLPTDEERKTLNQIIERLNQGAKTNLLLRYYWPLTADGLQGFSL